MVGDDTLQSRSIAFLRFPLIIGVILIHNAPDVLINLAGEDPFGGEYRFLWLLNNFIFCFILNVRVPLFFFISGFLFFHKVVDFDGKVYANKLKNRVHTLLVPYLFWNTFVLLIYWFAQQFLPSQSFFSGHHKPIGDYGWIDLLRAYWDGRNGTPLDYILWFIRNLMVMVVLSPLLYRLIKRFKVYFVLVLGLFWYFSPFELFPGLTSESLFFFCAGAFFSIAKLNLITEFRKVFAVSIALFLLVATVDYFSLNAGFNDYIHRLNVIFGIPFFFNIVGYFIENGKIKESIFLSGASFFVFVGHEPLLSIVRKLFFILIKPHHQAELLLMYFLIPTIVIGILLFSYRWLKTYFPKLLNIVSGGR